MPALLYELYGYSPILIEMLIVLMVISVLIMLIVPNLGGRSAEVNEKGCDALVSLVQAQVDAYYIEENEYPESLTILQNDDFITADQQKCPNGEALSLEGSTVINPYDG
ncbi:competence type IV pilus major pilin ComGC [Oceanobacillus salinisoli]|uniref:competence type IV pilus major pilin ComGC n=1 Tax=Oceanobacillus salinisoli TaxID=2678611 RepID=UPI0012E2D6AE|nr:competence type IV pilus major pilin ComGC [Oceanobacillus salinisoli]